MVLMEPVEADRKASLFIFMLNREIVYFTMIFS